MYKISKLAGNCSRLLKGFGFAEWYIFLFLFVSLFAGVIANDKPLLRICNGSLSFPFINKQVSEPVSSSHDDCFILLAPVPYHPYKSDQLNTDFAGPFDEQWSLSKSGDVVKIPWRSRHWLGTNMRGNDLAADIIYGTRVSFFVSVLSTFVSFLIGGLLGFTAGWYGPGRNKISLYGLLAGVVLFFFTWFFTMNLQGVSDRVAGYAMVLVLAGLFIFISGKIKNTKIYKTPFFFSSDLLIQRCSEVFSAIPRIVFILSIVPLMEASFFSVIFLLSVSGWVDISRLLRSEIQRLKKEGFVEAAKVSGVGGFRLFTGQMLPNLWPSMLVILLYTFAGNIAAEASLSFLGFGLPADVVTLGSLVASGKVYFEAWWMVVFPGLWISGFVFSLFSLSRKLRSRYEVKSV